jgi:hypothetical protein
MRLLSLILCSTCRKLIVLDLFRATFVVLAGLVFSQLDRVTMAAEIITEANRESLNISPQL